MQKLHDEFDSSWKNYQNLVAPSSPLEQKRDKLCQVTLLASRLLNGEKSATLDKLRKQAKSKGSNLEKLETFLQSIAAETLKAGKPSVNSPSPEADLSNSKHIAAKEAKSVKSPSPETALSNSKQIAAKEAKLALSLLSKNHLPIPAAFQAAAKILNRREYPEIDVKNAIDTVSQFVKKIEVEEFYPHGKVIEIVGTKDVFEGCESHLPNKLVVASGHLGLLFNEAVLKCVSKEIGELYTQTT